MSLINSTYKHTDIPEEIINKQNARKRKLIVRFSSQQDVDDFTSKTGIFVDINKHTTINYPINKKLIDILDI